MKFYFSTPQTSPLWWFLSPIFISITILIFIMNHFFFKIVMDLDLNIKSSPLNWKW